MKVADHVVEAFRAFLEVRFNGILYAREERTKTRIAEDGPRFELYFKGMKRVHGKPSVARDGDWEAPIARAARRGR